MRGTYEDIVHLLSNRNKTTIDAVIKFTAHKRMEMQTKKKSDTFKKTIAALSFLVLFSGCSRPIATAVEFTQPMATTPPTALFITSNTDATVTPAVVTPTPDFTCANAPTPRLNPEQQVTVLVEDWDKLKLRSSAAVDSDNVVMELDQYTQLRILDGPVCVAATDASYVFWKVAVIPSGEIGWVAEGDLTHYFIQ